jgi:predicted SAM-dependent methyltransferase
MSGSSRLRNNRLVRGLLGPVNRRLDHHDAQLAVHEQAIGDIIPALQEVQGPRLAKLESSLTDMEQYVPDLLAAGSLARGGLRRQERELTKHWAEIGRLWERIETVRQEILFEQRYGPRTGAASGGPEAPARPQRVVDPTRLEAALAGGAVVNLGAGHVPLDGFVNVDFREMPGIDVVAPVDDLPFEPDSLAGIHSAHVLEHFPEAELRIRLLPYWFGLIRPGGRFTCVVPDGGAMLSAHAAGEVSFADLREVLYGGQEYEGDFHQTLFTTETLSELLNGAGFVDVEVVAAGRQNGICLEFELSASKPR